MQIEIDKILFSRRSTYSLQITEDARLIIKVPLYTDEKEINRIVNKHKRWITKKITLAKLINQRVKKYKFKEGEMLMYLGNPYRLCFIQNQSELIVFNNKFNISSEYSSTAKNIIINWYKARAREIFTERVEHYSKLYNFRFRKIKLSSALKKWGSCSTNGDINLTWRLVMAPLDVIDYVVVHELVHLKIKNHSKEFWKMVANILPDYQIQKAWLKENEPLLRIT